LDKYLNMRAPIVAGSERVCFGNCVPPTCKQDDSVVAKDDRPFLNGGCVMGSAADLYTLYAWERENYPADDQIAMSQFRNMHCDVIHLDRRAEIVFNWSSDDARDRRAVTPLPNGRFQIDASRPCIIHMPFIVADLGYRWDTVLAHVLPDYQPIYTKGQMFHNLIQHVTDLVRSNKSYFVFILVLCYGSLLFFIFLIVGGVFAVQSFIRAVTRYENGH
jgi:hypothetical protein